MWFAWIRSSLAVLACGHRICFQIYELCAATWLWHGMVVVGSLRHSCWLQASIMLMFDPRTKYVYLSTPMYITHECVCMHAYTYRSAYTQKNIQFSLCMTLYAYVHKQTQSHIRHHHLCLQRRIRSQHPLRRIYIYVYMCMCIEVHLLFSSDKK